MVRDRYNAAGFGDPTLSLAEVATRLSRLPLQNQPGTTWEYSMSMDLLGRVIEVVSGRPLPRFFAERIFTPLGMHDTAFVLTAPSKLERVAQPQASPTGKRPNLPDPAGTTWPSGGGGLVSTAADYGRLCQMLLNGGELDGVRVLSPASVGQMVSDQLPPDIRVNAPPLPIIDTRREHGQSYGLGFAVRIADGLSPFPGSIGDASWTGAFGTQFWIDPKRDLYAILLVQLPPLSPGGVHEAYWERMRALVYGALIDPATR